MSEERIDVVLRDQVSEGPASKLKELATQARAAHAGVKDLKSEMSGFDAKTFRAFRIEKERAVASEGKAAVVQERVKAATARTATAQSNLAAAEEKVARARQQTALATAKVTTEAERLNAATARTEKVRNSATAATLRSRRADEQAGDAAAKLFREREKLIEQGRRQQQVTNSQQSVISQGYFTPKTAPVKSARASASVFRDAEAEAKSVAKLTREADALRASLNPTVAAKNAFNREIAQATRLFAAGAITQDTYTAAVNRSRAGYKSATQGMKELSAAQAKLTTFQKLTIQYTINDVIASLASGASPLTILAQQGGQVTQAWGGVIPTLRAAAGALLTGKAAVIGLVASGVGLLAWIDNAKREFAGLDRQLNITNGSAGLTRGAFLSMTDGIADAGNKSRSSTRDIALAWANTGQVSGQQIRELTEITQAWAKVSEQSTDEVLKRFSKIIDQPSKFAREFNAQYNIMSAKQYEHIRQLEETGQKTAATNAVSKLLYDYYAKEVPKSLGYVESAWNRVGVAIANAIQRAKDWGRDQTKQERIAELRATAAEKRQRALEPTMAGNAAGGVPPAVLRAQADAAEREANQLARSVSLENEAATARERGVRTQREGIESAEYLRTLTASIADNETRAADEIKRFRAEMERAGKADPTNKEYLWAKGNQKAIEAGIRKKYAPDGVKAAEKAAKDAAAAEEKYDAVLQRVILGLEREVKSQTLVDDQREKSRKMDAIDIQFLKTKQELTGANREKVERLVDAQIRGEEVQRAITASYNDATGPARAYLAAIEAIEFNRREGNISGEKAAAQQWLAKDAYEAAHDPLYQLRKETQEFYAVTGKFNDEREIELSLYRLKQAAQMKGIALSNEEAEAARAAVAALIEKSRLQAIEQSQLDQGPNARRDRGLGFQAAANNIGRGGFTRGDATNAVAGSTSIPGLFDGTGEAMQANQERHAQMYAELERLRALDLVSVQTYEAAKIKIQNSAGEASYNLATGFFGNLAAMQKSKSKDMQRIGKAAAIAQATIDTYRAATGAYASLAGIPYVGPALGAAAAAAAVVAGLAQVQQIRAQPAGFEQGGYTGDYGRKQAVGVVHGQEYVMNADATAANRDVLEAMNRGGRAVTSSPRVGNGGSRRPLNLRIDASKAPGIEWETNQISEDDVEVIATRVVNRRAPALIGSEFGRPTSKVSKGLMKNTKTQRRMD